MPNVKNQTTVKNLKEKIAKAKSIVFADFQGLSSNKTNELRAKMKETGSEIEVAKNTLLKIALTAENVPTKDLDAHLQGQTAAVLAYEDPISPLKMLLEFSKKFDLPKIKAAIISGVFATATQIEVLSKLPPRELLLAQVFGTMKSPIRGFAAVLKGNQRDFVSAIKAIADKKGGVTNG